MHKSDHARRQNAARRTRPRGSARHNPQAISRSIPEERPLLERILATPHLAHVVPRLQPELLHRVIQRCGLEDCGDLVALATPHQLMRVFDLDLWRAAPGVDEQLDADRFGLWLEVLLDAGADVAAEKLIGLDIELVVGALAQHVRVFDGGVVSAFTTTDGELVAPYRRPDEGHASEIGGYLVEARRLRSWDAIVSLLLSLEAERPDFFHRVMAGCRALSNSTPEADGFHNLLTDREQDLFDLAVDREERREQQGYATPAQARAFLQMARQLRLGDAAPPRSNPIAAAYLRSIEWTAPAVADERRDPSDPPAASEPEAEREHADAVASVVEVLREAGVIPQQPRALLGAAPDDPQRVSRLQSHMLWLNETDPAACASRTAEFGYLANTMMAGCSIQGRAFTDREASDAAAAVCNLGLESWPRRWIGEERELPADFLAGHDLVTVFQVGWTVLHRRVIMYTADRLMDILGGLHYDEDMQERIDALRIGLARHGSDDMPWRASDALDVIMILDMTAWATLVGLIAEFPVIHAAMSASRAAGTREVSPSAFELISSNAQIAAIHDFLQSLPATLGG